jgi:hypothetical protein
MIPVILSADHALAGNHLVSRRNPEWGEPPRAIADAHLQNAIGSP